MENMDNEIFGFGTDYDYETINGLGESNYENEDLFENENTNAEPQTDSFEVFGVEEDFGEISNSEKSVETNAVEDAEEVQHSELVEQYNQDDTIESPQFEEEFPFEFSIEEDMEIPVVQKSNQEAEQLESNSVQEPVEIVEESQLEEKTFNSNIEEETIETPVLEDVNEEVKSEENKSNIIMSDTPIEEINKLTEFETEKIDSIDINTLFDRVGVNVKEASDIFKKNTEMKEKIDSRFEELKKLQLEVEKSKQNQYDEINAYKTEVLDKLNEKKEEIEKRLNKLKEFQSSLEKEKEEFEAYKKVEKEEIEKVQREVQEAYDSRREELNHVEDILRKQKDALDEERSQLSLDRIQYEADKNELANNLLKFNEIVDSFTNGMDKLNKE